MSGFSAVLVISLLMGVSSFVSGLIPISSKLGPRSVRLASVFGSGLLLSAALVLIIPEGLERIGDGAVHTTGILLLLGYFTLHLVQNIPHLLPLGKDAYKNSGAVDDTELQIETPVEASGLLTEGYMHLVRAIETPFTLGLIIHSLCDGVALASTVSSEDLTLQVTVFFAVFLHKLPAAFGLSSVLRSYNLERKEILWHLFYFSVSAPLAAIVSYAVLSILNASSDHISGMLLLYSGGSFLFVAFHALMDTFEHSSQHSAPDSSPLDDNSERLEFAVNATGMLVPILVSFAQE